MEYLNDKEVQKIISCGCETATLLKLGQNLLLMTKKVTLGRFAFKNANCKLTILSMSLNDLDTTTRVFHFALNPSDKLHN